MVIVVLMPTCVKTSLKIRGQKDTNGAASRLLPAIGGVVEAPGTAVASKELRGRMDRHHDVCVLK